MSTNQDVLKSKLRLGLVQLPYLKRALVLVWDAARSWTLVWFVLLVMHGYCL
jgi:hypothetical protein